MAEEKKLLGFEIGPSKYAVYSKYSSEIAQWSALLATSRDNKEYWLSPMSAGLNYGLSVFEGMKAFRHKSGEIFLFRAKNHAQRFRESLSRLLMPVFPETKFMRALELLVTMNEEFIPEYRQGSLYIRPIAWGCDKLGVSRDPKLAYSAAFWCSPVGNYYTDGLKPIAVYVAREMTRAMPNGVGYCKTSGNYVISMLANFVAKHSGCQDALFLDGKYKVFVEELGAANVFMIKNNIIYTPRLTDTILPGITRKSVIALANFELGMKVHEEDIPIWELINADEVFATGTAAVITPISQIKDGEKMHTIGSGQTGEITKKIYELLTGIQYGDIEDKHNWLTKIET